VTGFGDATVSKGVAAAGVIGIAAA